MRRYIADLFLVYFIGGIIAILIIALCATAANAQQTQYRDRSGRIIGTSQQSGTQTIYRDSSGRRTATATQSGRTTTYRDASGRILIQQNGRGQAPIPYLLRRK